MQPLKNEVEDKQSNKEKSVQHEEISIRAVQGQAQGDLRYAEQSDRSTKPVMQHSPERQMEISAVFLAATYDTSCDGLYPKQYVDGESDAMMRVGERSFWSDCKEAQGDDHSGKEQSSDLQPNVEANSISRTAAVEAHEEDGAWNNGQEGDGRNDSVRLDERVVPGHGEESVCHTYAC